MKKLILKTAIFILIFIALDNISYKALSVLTHRADPLYVKVLRKKSQVLFFGNSQTMYGVIPEVISQRTGMSSHNVARYSSGMVYARAVQSIILSHYHPKLLVVQVTEFYRDRDRVSAIAPYFDNGQVRGLLSYFPYNVKFKYGVFKTLRYNSIVFSSINRAVADYDPYNGYVPLYGSISASRTRAEGIPKGDVTFQAGLLKEFIEEAKRRSTEIALVALPFRDDHDNPSVKIAKNISEKYDVPFLDFSKKRYFPPSLTDDCFYDSAHFNKKGAEIFSGLLAEEIARIIK